LICDHRFTFAATMLSPVNLKLRSRMKVILNGMLMPTKGLLLIIVLSVMAGCATTYYEETRSFITYPVKYGEMVNSDVRIIAEDGSFTIEPRSEFLSPFQLDIYGYPTTTYFLSQYSECKGKCPPVNPWYMGSVDLMDSKVLIQAGAKRVVLEIDGTEKKLHGLLMLNQTFDEKSEHSRIFLDDGLSYLSTTEYVKHDGWKVYKPSVRSYEIKIPQNRINEALQGRDSVAYEIFAETGLTKSRSAYSWVLLLSKYPF